MFSSHLTRLSAVLVLLAIVCFTTVDAASTPPDTLDARMKVAAQIAARTGFQSRIDEMLKEKTRELEPADRDKIRTLLKKHLKVEVWRKLEIESLADTFTLGELNALEAFYRTADGRSILSKFADYLSKI